MVNGVLTVLGLGQDGATNAVYVYASASPMASYVVIPSTAKSAGGWKPDSHDPCPIARHLERMPAMKPRWCHRG